MPRAKKNQSDESPTNKKKGVKPVMGPNTGVKFSKDRQPDPKKVSDGLKRHYALRDLLNLTTGQKFEGSTKAYRKLTATYFGIKEEDVTVRMIMDFRQIEKAVLKGDTNAYKAVQDRAYGRPREEQAPIVEVSTNDGERTSFTLPGGIDLEI